MGFGVGIYRNLTDKGSIQGKLMEVACGCWFTSKGRTFPKLVKYEDEEGIICRIEDIDVLYSEKVYYCGIPMMTYACRAEHEGREYEFKLFYHTEENRWLLQWADR